MNPSDSNGTVVGATADTALPSFDIHVETCVMVDQDTDEQVVMWKANTDNHLSRSSSPIEAVMEVIERESGGEI